MRFVPAVAAAGLTALACNGRHGPKGATRGVEPVASASTSAAPPEKPKEPPTPSQAITFETRDKIPLSGTIYLAKDETAPVLVFVHRYRGDRQEWAPLANLLASAEHRYTIVNFDLRGHGESKSASGKKRLDWADMKEKDAPAFVGDVLAALDYGFERSKATRAVVVGSSLGAALAARAASEDARVVAVALVSPGAAIQGFDVYHPFADVRTLPSFLAAAKGDNVALDPMDALSRMAKDLATVKSYDGQGHGAFGLSAEGAPIFADLENWLMTVFDAQPVTRQILPLDAKKEHKG